MSNKITYGNEEIKNKFEKYLNDYNKTWTDKDIEKLKQFYDIDQNRLIYYDNHKNNDTYTVNEHLELVLNFFVNGKDTESGKVEELLIEDFNVFSNSNTACLCFIAKYKSFPKHGVRTTMYLENMREQWKVIHVHCSFEP